MNESLTQQCRSLWEGQQGVKWKYSLYSAFLFYILSSPSAYVFSNELLGMFVSTQGQGVPSAVGLFIHSFVYMLAVFGLMNLPKDV